MVFDNQLCECCLSQPATLIIVRRLRNDIYRTFVCPECAEERTRLYIKDGFDLDRILIGLDKQSTEPEAAYSCRLCGSTLADLVTSGRPGCCACYSKFAGEIEIAVEKAQGRIYHVGKTPGI